MWNYTSQQLQAFLRSQEKKAVVLLMGCSGAGKSHTLLGNTFYAQRGILPRFLESVWGSRGADGATVRDIDKAFESESVSLLQLKAFVVQNEKIIDLLDPPKASLLIHLRLCHYSASTLHCLRCSS